MPNQLPFVRPRDGERASFLEGPWVLDEASGSHPAWLSLEA